MAGDGYYLPDEAGRRVSTHVEDSDHNILDAYRLGSIDCVGRAGPGSYVRHDADSSLGKLGPEWNKPGSKFKPSDFGPLPGDVLITAGSDGLVIYSRKQV